jgi:hypothetical protein
MLPGQNRALNDDGFLFHRVVYGGDLEWPLGNSDLSLLNHVGQFVSKQPVPCGSGTTVV